MRDLTIPRITSLQLPGQVWAVWVLLALNVLMFFVAQVVSLLLANTTFCRPAPSPYICALAVLGWKDNLLIFQGDYWRLLTATFLHSGIWHLFMNGFGLFIFGPDTERVYGSLRFTVLYLLAGLCGSVASYAFSANPAVGASGSLFGVVGGLSVFFYRTRHILGTFGQMQMQGLVVWIVIGLVFGLTEPNVDNFGHIGGLIGGLAAGWLLLPGYQNQRDIFALDVTQFARPLDWVGVGVMLVVIGGLTIIISPPL